MEDSINITPGGQSTEVNAQVKVKLHILINLSHQLQANLKKSYEKCQEMENILRNERQKLQQFEGDVDDYAEVSVNLFAALSEFQTHHSDLVSDFYKEERELKREQEELDEIFKLLEQVLLMIEYKGDVKKEDSIVAMKGT
ncbi:hypothetical protein J7T55_004931 [Diaporthe amygdali]|uniref:uncharacterized protein n=1 Tax=Phomopsis amygdali TaxID=1214568 RepID=UPI0022FF1569|nr:uncharacterized protein J7T55_004931 [Diaporthe amygdali]KAJ0114687.1 hypothetical protein J7T55_004931 [Diaporthe amygdali]